MNQVDLLKRLGRRKGHRRAQKAFAAILSAPISQVIQQAPALGNWFANIQSMVVDLGAENAALKNRRAELCRQIASCQSIIG